MITQAVQDYKNKPDWRTNGSELNEIDTSNNYNTPAVMGLGYDPGGIHNPKNKRPGFSAGDRTNGSELNDWSKNPSQPSPPSTQQPTRPDPQEFADQKKAEVKKTYSTSHGDRINNAYRDHYGRNAHADEIANWTGTGMGIEDIQKGLKTSFARDGEHLGEDQLANLQIPQEPQQPQQPTQPVETKPPTLVEHENRYAGSNAFRDQLQEAKNLGQTPQTPAPQTPQTPQGSQTPENTNSINQPVLSDTSKSLLDLNQGKIDNNQGLAAGRERVDSIVNNASQGFNNQLKREADMRANSPITQDVTNRFQQFSLLNEDAQRGRGDFSSFANAAIRGGRDNRALDTAALDMNIRSSITNMGDKARLGFFNIFGDMGRNARENPYSWSPSQPTPKVETPDFDKIYRNTKKDIDSI